jgi:hypothetical protein
MLVAGSVGIQSDCCDRSKGRKWCQAGRLSPTECLQIAALQVDDPGDTT